MNLRTLLEWLAIGLVMFLILNQLYIGTILQTYVPYREDAQWEELHLDHLDIAVFGDSQPANGVRADLMGESFNFATIGQKYAKTYIEFREVLKDTDIEVIVLPLDPHTFAENYDYEPAWLADVRLYKSRASWNELSEIYTKDTSLLREVYFPFIGRGSDLVEWINPSFPSTMIRGWVMREGVYIPHEESMRTQFEDVFGKPRLSPHLLDYFEKTLALAKEHDVDIVFVRYPIHDSYDQLVQELDNEHYYVELFKIIERYEGNQAIYFDYNDLFDDYQEYFKDTNHLNAEGAKAFTEVLYDDVKSAGLLQ